MIYIHIIQMYFNLKVYMHKNQTWIQIEFISWKCVFTHSQPELCSFVPVCWYWFEFNSFRKYSYTMYCIVEATGSMCQRWTNASTALIFIQINDVPQDMHIFIKEGKLFGKNRPTTCWHEERSQLKHTSPRLIITWPLLFACDQNHFLVYKNWLKNINAW